MKRLLVVACSLFSTLSLAADRVIINPDNNGDVKIKVNQGGSPVDALTVTGSTGVVSLSQPLPVASGGTGGVTQSAARTGLGLGTLSTVNSGSITDVDINGSAGIATSKLSGPVTSIPSNGLGSLATLSAVGSSTITDGSIINIDINSSAAIDGTKIVSAGAVVSGVVTTGAQTFGGLKTFQNGASISTNGGNVPHACSVDSSSSILGTTYTHGCPPAHIAVGGGCKCDSGSCSSWKSSYPGSITEWLCEYDTVTQFTVYVVCCRY